MSASTVVSSEQFRRIIGHFTTGVTVVTVAEDEQPLGTTASAVSSVSLEPPMLLVCLNRESATGQAIRRSGVFAINVLKEDQHDLAVRFAGKGAAKFEGVAHDVGTTGLPLLGDALAHIECEVTEQMSSGTHIVFLGVVRAAASSSGAPLAYYRGQFGRLEMHADQHMYETVREQILRGDLEPGVPLDLHGLAEGLSVPFGALYHVLGRLNADGLLDRTDSGAFFVPEITWPIVRDALRARCALEMGVIDATIADASEEDVLGLRAAMERSLIRKSDGSFQSVDAQIATGGRFHETLVSLAKSRSLLSAYQRLALPGIMASAFHRGNYAFGPADEPHGHDHAAIVEAYERRDADAARSAVLAHSKRAEATFLTAFERVASAAKKQS